MTQEMKQPVQAGEEAVQTPADVKITVDYHPGRWGKVFHLYDLEGREIILHQKDAVKLANNVIKIAHTGEGK